MRLGHVWPCIVDAYPLAVGHCNTGTSAMQYSPHGTEPAGALSLGSLRVSIDSTSLQSYTKTLLNVSQKYKVTLDFSTAGASFFFRGFLFRLSGKMARMSKVLFTSEMIVMSI